MDYLKVLEKNGIYINKLSEHEDGKILFMYPGHGSQYQSMFSGLINKYEIVKEIYEEAEKLFNKLSNGGSLINSISNGGDDLERAEVMQCAIYTADYAMHKLIEKMGVCPDILIGHSLGEFAALACSGVISFHEGFEIVYYRAEALNLIPKEQRGKMISLKLDLNSEKLLYITKELEERGLDFDIALNNSPQQTVISGEEESIKLVEELSEKNKIVYCKLKVSHGFHSKLLQPAMKYFKDKLMNYSFNTPQIKVFSTITNDFYSDNIEDYTTEVMANKLARQFVTPFSFNNIINELYNNSNVRYFVEVGASSILSNLVDEILEDKKYYRIASNEKKIDDCLCIERLKAYFTINNILNNNEVGEKRDMSKVEIEKLIKEIISEKTGYPEEILEDELDLEADLGIDSVKQMDIFSTLFENLNYDIKIDENIKFNSINDVIEFCTTKMYYNKDISNESCENQKDQESIESNESMSQHYLDRGEIEETLKQVIMEKTGYPKEVLENNLDLEADLGIDSLKQTDIIVSFASKLNIDVPQDNRENTNIIFSTIDSIIDYFCERNNQIEDKEVIDKDSLIRLYSDKNEHNRHVSVSKEIKYGNGKIGVFEFDKSNVILIEDRLGGAITEKILEKLLNKNCNVVVVCKGGKEYRGCKVIKSALNSIKEIKDAFKEAKEKLGKVYGIINLNSITKNIDFLNVSSEKWIKEVEEVYMISFQSIKQAYYDFMELGEKAFLLSASNIGGVFGVDYSDSDNSSAGINTGIVKAMSKEIETLHCKAIDFDDVSNSEFVAEKILDEISIIDEVIEIAYTENVRKTIVIVTKNINKSDKQFGRYLTEDDVIVFSGGGRGILNELVKGLISIYDPTIIITGRSEIPTGTEEWFNMTEEEFDNYKSEFINKVKGENSDLSVIDIVNRYESVRNRRELYKNIQTLKKMTNKVHYYQCDVSSEEDVKKLKNIVINKFGKVTGIVNGAGLPSFGILPKKHEIGSLNTVKVKGLAIYNLYHSFKDQPLKFFNNTGSISGRLGVDGQVDYVAGCDLATKMTNRMSKLDNSFNTFIIDWTAWDEVGMAAIPVVKKIQEGRGLGYISVNEGTKKFLEEITYGNESGEILIFNHLGNKENNAFELQYLNENKSPIDESGEIIDRNNYPYIDKVVKKSDDAICIEKKLDIKDDIHLRDHMVKGNYVFAAVSHVELYYEMMNLLNEMLGNEEWYLYKIESIDLKSFVKYFPQNELVLNARIKIKEKIGDKVILTGDIKSDFYNSKGKRLISDRLHSNGTIIVSTNPVEEKFNKRSVQDMLNNSIELDCDKYYELTDDSIHFGELFRNLIYTRKISNKEFFGQVLVVDDSKLFRNLKRVQTKMFPITIDCIGRVALIGIFNEYGLVAIPVRLSNIQTNRKLRKREIVYSYSRIKEKRDESIIIYQEFIDSNDNIICTLELELHVIAKYNEHNLE